jgi:endonuclease/exonuclease/phosphatase family metal-dependent hydrolase
MGADVYIVPEMASPDLLSISEEYGTIWIGDYKDKGLGVIYNKKLSCKVLPVKFEQKFAIPLRVEDKLVVAFWPTKIGDTKNMSYPKIAQLILEQLEEYFVKMPTLIVGDYNCYKGQSGETKTYSLEAIDNYLQLHGLYSLYHKKSGESIGEESICTYHHLFKEDKEMEFFIDFAYTNMEVSGFHIDSWESQISDHCAQTIDL